MAPHGQIFQDKKFNVVALENFSTGIACAIKNCEILDIDLLDHELLLSDCTKEKKLLQWKPIYSDIETIVTNAWNWHKFLTKNLL